MVEEQEQEQEVEVQDLEQVLVNLLLVAHQGPDHILVNLLRVEELELEPQDREQDLMLLLLAHLVLVLEDWPQRLDRLHMFHAKHAVNANKY